MRIFVEAIALGLAASYFLAMEKNGAVALKLLGLAFFGALLEWYGATKFLWAFPLVFPGLGAWLLFACGDVLLARNPLPSLQRTRLLLWCSGVMYFSARSGFPLLGIFLAFAPALLWLLSRGDGKGLLKCALPALGALFVLGHDNRFYHWQLQSEAGLGWHFSFHLAALFLFFRACSWLAAVAGRGERPGFLPTMEYFISPVFWLSPLHAGHLVWERMNSRSDNSAPAFFWILRALFHALCLSAAAGYIFPWVNGLYFSGIRNIAWYEWIGLGPVLFLVAYLDKSQVTYFVAGFLRLSGKNVEPDFRSPWLASDLLDYWRRFHYWLWEFYMNVIYPLILLPLARRMRPERALPLAIFISFTLGTGAAHYLSYRAELLMSLILALLFGTATVLHYFLRGVLKNPRIGIPATWISVSLLYILAYPVFGLGWGLAEFVAFFRS